MSHAPTDTVPPPTVAPARYEVRLADLLAPRDHAGDAAPRPPAPPADPPAQRTVSEPPPPPELETAQAAGAGVQLAPPSPLTGYRLPVGAHPGNTGGKPRRSGRPSNAFRRMCTALARKPALKRELAAILEDKDHPHFMKAVAFVAERAEGKVTQPIDHTATVTLAELLAPGHVLPPDPRGEEGS